MNEICELTETEVEAVVGGLFDIGVDVQTIVAPQIAWLSAAPVSSPPVAALPVSTSVVC